jgi:hypothetical protein
VCSDSTTRENPGGDAGGVRSSGAPGATMQRNRQKRTRQISSRPTIFCGYR